MLCSDTCMVRLFTSVPDIIRKKVELLKVNKGYIHNNGISIICRWFYHFQLPNEELEEFFAQHGKVSSARVITDRETQRSKGFRLRRI
jgi:RNA recognition motif-containing protein